MHTTAQRDRHLESTADKIRNKLNSEPSDLVVLPELSSIDYSRRSFDNLSELAESLHGPSFDVFRSIAMEFDLVMVYGIPRKNHNHFRITQVVVGTDGQIIGHFDKLHIAHFGASPEKDYFRQGEHIFAFEHHGIKIAPIICYDIRIPELTRSLLLKHDIQLLLHCGAYGRDESFYSWHHFVVTRALENQIYVLSLNRAGKEFGNSLFCGPWIDEQMPATNFPQTDESIKSLVIDPRHIDDIKMRYSFLTDKFDDYNQL